MKKTSLLRLCSVGLAPLLLLSACATEGGDEPGGDDAAVGTDGEVGASGELNGPINADPRTFNPAQAGTQADYQVARLGFDSLLRRDNNEDLVAGIASEWEMTDSGVKMTIRDDATCSDGSQITGEVVANSLEYFADPENGAPQRQAILGPGDAEITHDGQEVEISLSQPYSELLVGLTHPAAGIICPAGLEDLEGLNAGGVEGANSGPYSATEVQSGVNYTFEFNDDYQHWPEYTEALEGHPAQTINMIPNAMDTAPNQILTGQMDFAAVEHFDLPRFEDGPYTISQGSNGEVFLVFNQTESSPFADKDMRRAAAQVIRQDEWREIVDPEAELIYSTADDTVLCAATDPEVVVPADPEAAAEVLDGVDISINSTNIFGTNGAGGEYLAEALRGAGANVDLTNTDTGTWIDTVLAVDERENWDVTLWSTVNISGALVNGLSRTVGETQDEGGRNFSYSKNEAAKEAYERALDASDEESMCEAFLEAQEIMLEDIGIIPLTTDPNIVVLREGVTLQHIAGREDVSTLRITD